jgi:hypothetical protein
MHKADAELARLEEERRAAPDQHGGGPGPIGIEVRLPEGFSRP